MPAPREVAVLIPARNEEVLLARCLASAIRAMDALPVTIDASIVLVSDCSTDRTAEIAYNLIGERGTILHTRAGAVGTARALAANYALEKTTMPLSEIWLANTDADCIVPSTWLTDQINFAVSGFDALAGIVSVDNFHEHSPEVPARFEASYSIHADGTHPHIHAANLGVKADRYVEAGGWASLKTGEDHYLWARLKGTGARLVSSARIRVVTSGRRVGRAPNGFAQALAAHNDIALVA